MPWFKHERLLTSHQNKEEYMEKTRIDAILDTKAVDVQSVGVMNDGRGQYFFL
jgi:hypothetical protein